MPANSTVAVIGLGYVGSCVAGTLAGRGFDVIGVDVDPTLVRELNAGYCRFREDELAGLLLRTMDEGRLRVTDDQAAAAAADVVLITVGTPVRPDGTLVDDQLRDVCRTLAGRLRENQLVVVKSTVPPGTTRDLVLPLLTEGGGTGFKLAFTPERLAEGTALKELRSFPIVVGGLDEESTAAAAEFWREALDVEVLVQESLEAAEIVKLADNWWIDLNIALANELARFCALYGVDVLDVIAAANSIPKGAGKVNILSPGVGVGGSCLTKDPWMVWRAAKDRGLDVRTVPVGRDVNAEMPRYTARIILDELAKLGKDPSSATVAVLGLAFKNDTGDLRETPVRSTIAELLRAGVRVRAHDPLADAAQAKELLGFAPEEDLRETVEGADCVAVLALHSAFRGLDFASLPVKDGCVVLDGRAYYSKEEIASLRRSGFVYRGIGR